MIEVPFSMLAPTTYDGARRPNPSLEWLRNPVTPAVQVTSALDRVRRAPTILSAMRVAPELLRIVDGAVRGGVSTMALLEPILEAVADESDSVTASAAVHALGRVRGAHADDALATILSDARPGLESHATWVLSGRPAASGLVRILARGVTRGDLTGMHAQRALAAWAETQPDLVLEALESGLRKTESAGVRRHLVETIGLVPGQLAQGSLERIALDGTEPVAVRTAAIAAFTERLSEALPASLGRLATTDDALGQTVRDTRARRQLARRGPLRDHGRRAGIRVAQLHLGDVGGLATLLPQLGDALSDQGRIAETITIVRSGAEAEAVAGRPNSGHRLEDIALADGEGVSFTTGWPSIIAVTRGIRASLLAGPLPDVLHLRMADPGSLAGAEVARELGIPTVFTLAPDPHGPIAAAEASGTLGRRSFADEDARSALWFRARLAERLARDARELVLFPRTDLPEQIERLTGIDLSAGPPRHTVVSEGIDTRVADHASAAITTATTTPAVISDLQRAIRSLPVERHGLPLVVSVGRLHELKGMARLVEAFAKQKVLADRANLVIVGGDLGRPSASEAAELARMHRLIERHPGLDQRVVLLGRRAHHDVALVLAAVRTGWGAFIAKGGAYACASRKEEFGLAVVEAMAAGLPVVAPREGGPATYVEHGLTGLLVDTTDIVALSGAIEATLDLAQDAATAPRARRVVEDRFTLERMARTMSAVYRISAGAATLGLPVEARAETAA